MKKCLCFLLILIVACSAFGEAKYDPIQGVFREDDGYVGGTSVYEYVRQVDTGSVAGATGDMTKAMYDTNDNGNVDTSDAFIELTNAPPYASTGEVVAVSGRVSLIELSTQSWDTAYGWGDWSTRMGVVEGKTGNWNTAYGWGDWNARVGTIEGRTGDWNTTFGWGDWNGRMAILEGRTGDWNNAFSWGNHAVAGYSTTTQVQSVALDGSNYADRVTNALGLADVARTDPDLGDVSVTNVPVPTVDSGLVPKVYADNLVPARLDLFMRSDLTLTNDVLGLASTTTSFTVTGAVSNQHIWFWTVSNVVDVIEAVDHATHLHAETDAATGVGLQTEIYFTNAAEGLVEVTAGDTAFFNQKNVEQQFNLHCLNIAATNITDLSLFGVAVVIFDRDGRTPDITFYMEGLEKAKVTVPIAAANTVFLPRSGSLPMTGSLGMGNGNKVIDSAVGVDPTDLPTMGQLNASNTLAVILADDPNAGGLAFTNWTDRIIVYYSSVTTDVSMADSGWTYIFDAEQGQAVFHPTNLVWNGTNLWKTHYINKGTGSQLFVEMENDYVFSRFPSNTIASVITNRVNTMTVKQGGSNWVVGTDMGGSWTFGAQP